MKILLFFLQSLFIGLMAILALPLLVVFAWLITAGPVVASIEYNNYWFLLFYIIPFTFLGICLNPNLSEL